MTIILQNGIILLVEQLAMGWMTKGLEFESQWGKNFSFLHVIQTSFGAHPASHPMSTGGYFPRSKVAGA
jgi:hypothetical protein